jgi:uncharacterized protein with NRDE domain
VCILFVAVQQHKDYPLIIAANRDEFFKRQTASSRFWPDSPHILAGRDLEAGGSWMGINQQGFLAALTNIRDPQQINPQARTRGELVSHYLQRPSKDYQQQLENSRQHYNGYNLLYGHWQNLAVYNNQLNSLERLRPGYYGLSNANLNSPWPKVNKGVKQLQAYCQNGHNIESSKLFELLLDNQQAPDYRLPKTGVPLDWERRLSAIFITGQDYGTRSSTVLKIDHNQQVYWRERSYSNDAQCISEQSYQFSIN